VMRVGKMPTIKQLLHRKGHHFLSIASDATVLSAIELMAKENVGSLLVTDGDQLAGIITERIYAREVEVKGRSAKDTLVKDVMRRQVDCLAPTDSVEKCMALMVQKRLRYLPVVDQGRISGIVSIGDLSMYSAEDQRFTIDQLEHYINGDLHH
jgi:CBS domain-containing protein